MNLDKVILDYLYSLQETQGVSKRLLKTADIECKIVKLVGGQREYNHHYGYRFLFDSISKLMEEGILVPLAAPVTNGKKPSLHQKYWLIPKEVQYQWNPRQMAKVMRHLNLEFYIRNKHCQTLKEWELIQCIYDFMVIRESCVVINREERSNSLFKHIKLPDKIEPEKFLSSSSGKALMNRLNLTPADLKYKWVREPFHFWKNEKASAANMREVLIIEGLPTYNTIKEYLQTDLPWYFGPFPGLIVWGEGYRIESTINYLQEVAGKVESLNIRYLGDLDYEGFNIFINLKQKNRRLHISLALPFYLFLLKFKTEFKTGVTKKQRIVEKNLIHLRQEFVGYEVEFGVLHELWMHKERIAQECINFETILRKGEYLEWKGY
ncbi:Wadjet anti-phage system protein JetD domain-containing protein [Rossellomorea aquimaris]|uniref:Wadjet protein JetD C-terminal domain-containing protein n=1 Tax=Rossellomorea aquimaris TaxID=189382 RepID=A0A5D4TR95_9BACI|nr:Wadjet anti-phage system protein JetD domain-containing protein [Rossellomorea aquimaris]TYS76586.1 hypothetical protein FZC80_14885 [Rossellomorea aquimaris]